MTGQQSWIERLKRQKELLIPRWLCAAIVDNQLLFLSHENVKMKGIIPPKCSLI